MHPPICLLAFAFTLVLGSLPAQSSPAPGHRFFTVLGNTATPMLDVAGNTIHTWNSAFGPATSAFLMDDGTLLRSIAVTNNGLPGGFGGGVQRLALDGTVLWDYRVTQPGLFNHHDIVGLPNGNVLLTVWEDKTVAEAIAAGRDPVLINGTVMRPDGILEVQPTGPTSGTVVWEWHVWDHLIQDVDPSAANYGVVGSAPGRIDVNYPADPTAADDWNHVNGLDYDPIHDWIVISAHHQNEIWIIDHGTTTAEAAGSSGGRWGRGGDLLWRWGNPEAYRAGTPNDRQLGGQHDPRFVLPGRPGAGHVTVFNNLAAGFSNSAALELVLPLDAAGNLVLGPSGSYGPAAPVWSYSAPGFFSRIISSVERLPNGNTLICSGDQGRLFEVDAAGRTVWQYQHPTASAQIFHAHYTERSLWADVSTVSIAAGGAVQLDMRNGTGHAGEAYLMLGTFSGTDPGLTALGVHIPLNPDFLFDFMVAQPNQGPLLQQTFGSLDALGRGTARIVIAPGLMPAALRGLQLDFACVLADPSLSTLTHATNAVPVRITP